LDIQEEDLLVATSGLVLDVAVGVDAPPVAVSVAVAVAVVVVVVLKPLFIGHVGTAGEVAGDVEVSSADDERYDVRGSERVEVEELLSVVFAEAVTCPVLVITVGSQLISSDALVPRVTVE